MSATSEVRNGLVDPPTGPRNDQAFREDLEKELARVRRYGHGIAVLLAEIDSHPQGEQGESEGRRASLQAIATCLKVTLRAGDAVYRLAPDQFAAILPFTREAGGESAALRLKRGVSEAVRDSAGHPVSVSVGIVSVHPHDSLLSSQDVVGLAEKDLDLDKHCQAFAPAEITHESRVRRTRAVQEGVGLEQVLLISGDMDDLRRMSDSLRGTDYEVYTSGSRRHGLALFRQLGAPLVVLDHEDYADTGTLNEFCSLVRSSAKGGEAYIIVAVASRGTETAIPLIQSADDVVEKPIRLSELLARVRVGSQLRHLRRELAAREWLKSTLHMADAATHELKQPLQVMLGKAELLLMEMNEGDSGFETFSEIRKQIFRIDNIAQKLARIIHHELKESS